MRRPLALLFAISGLLACDAKPAAPDEPIAACEEYVATFRRCIDEHMPEESRASMRASLDAALATWEQTATTPTGRAALQRACLRLTASTRRTTARAGCEW